jgi:hypothetical protein
MKFSILAVILSVLFIFPNCKSFRKDNEREQLQKSYQQFSMKKLRFSDSVLVLYKKGGLQNQSGSLKKVVDFQIIILIFCQEKLYNHDRKRDSVKRRTLVIITQRNI